MTSAVKILLVDEEPILRRATALMLTGRGGKVSAVATLDEALALARRQIFDVAVVDVASGGPHPDEIVNQLREIGLPPRRVVVCACGEPVERQEAKPFAAVISKPYMFEHLVTAVFGPRNTRRRTRSGVFTRVGAGPAVRAGRTKRAATRSSAPLQLALPRPMRPANAVTEGAPPTVLASAGRAGRARNTVRGPSLERAASSEARRAAPLPVRGEARRAVRARRGRE